MAVVKLKPQTERWTCKSTRALAEELESQGFSISSTKVGTLLKSQGYSLQSNKKTVEGKQHPDRNAQFEFIARRITARRALGPVFGYGSSNGLRTRPA